MANILLISIIVFSAEVTVIGITSGHLLCASTIIKNCCPINVQQNLHVHGAMEQMANSMGVMVLGLLCFEDSDKNSNFEQRIQVPCLSLATTLVF